MGLDNQAQIELSRRQFLQVSSLAAIEVVSNGSWAPKAVLGMLSKLQAQAGGYLIKDLPFTPTFGEQSFPWMPAKEGHLANFEPHDELEQLVYGSRAYSAYRGSTGGLIQNGAEAEARSKPNGFFWTGWCQAASVAAWCLPEIGMEDRPLPGGLVISYADQLFLGTVYSAYGLVEREWGRLDPNSYSEIQDIHSFLKENQIPKALIADTSEFRSYPGQEWWGCLHGFDGDMVDLTSFFESNELNGDPRKPFPIPFDQITRVKLIDPSQPQSGKENNYWYTLNRDIAKVCLGMAELVLQ